MEATFRAGRRPRTAAALPLLLAAVLLLAGLAPARETGWIVGRVTDPAGNPLADAAVTAVRTDSAPQQWSTRSGETGGFQFPGLPAGSYQVTASRTGYAPREQRVVLAPGERRGVILRLRRG
jgi:hypothetical protein